MVGKQRSKAKVSGIFLNCSPSSILRQGESLIEPGGHIPVRLASQLAPHDYTQAATPTKILHGLLFLYL